MSHQGQFPLSNRDVISVVVCPQAPNHLYSGQTHRFQDLLFKLAATIGVQSSCLTESEMLGLIEAGIPCDLLQPGMDWQSGRLKLTLSFEANTTDSQTVASPIAVESVPEVISEAAATPSFATMATVAAVATPLAVAAAVAAVPAAAIAIPEMPEADEFDLDEFTVAIDPIGEAAPAMDLDDSITAFADDDQLDAVEEVTFVRAPAAPGFEPEADQMVAAALGDMDGLDDVGLLESELDNGFGDMPSFDDTSGFGDGDLSGAIDLGEPDLFDLGEPEPLEPELAQPVGLAALEDEFDFGDLDQPDQGTMVDVPRETAGASVESLDLGLDSGLDSGFDFDSESAAIEAGMNAALGFEDDLEMPSLGNAPVADSLGDAFDFGDDLDLEAPAGVAEFSLDSDFDLEMDLGNLAMDAAKMDALDPASPATLSPEAKATKPVDTASLDALGFDELDNPWDLSDDLDAMLLSNGPLA